MKYHRLSILLAAEAVLLIALSLCGAPKASALSFPYAVLGSGLRALSLSSSIGNIAAWALYLLLGASPLAWLCVRAAKRRAHIEDALLIPFSAVLFYALYLLINPAKLVSRMAPSIGTSKIWLGLGGAALGCALHALLLAYLVLRLMRSADRKEDNGVLRAMRCVLCAVAALLVFGLCGDTLPSLIERLEALREGNTAISDSALAPSIAFTVLRMLVLALPLLFGLMLTFSSLRLIDAFAVEPFGDAALIAAHRMGRRAKTAAATVLLSQAGLNVLQVLLAKRLHSTDHTVSLPLTAILLMLSLMLLARFIERGKRLKADNDSII